MNSSRDNVGSRVLASLAVGALFSALIPAGATGQNVYESIRHASGDRTVEITTNFPRANGCRKQFPIADTVDVTVSGWVDASAALLNAPPGFADRVLAAVRSRLHLPATMTATVFGPDSLGVVTVSGAVAFTLDAGGQVHNVHMVSKATTSTFDDVLPEAVKNAGSDRRYPPFPAEYRDKSVDFVVTLSTVLWGTGNGTDIIGATAPAEMFAVTVERYRGFNLASGLLLPPGLSLYAPPPSTNVTTSSSAPAVPGAVPNTTSGPGSTASSASAPSSTPAAAPIAAPPSAGGAGAATGPLVWAEFVAGPNGRVVPGTLRILGTESPETVTRVQSLLMQATMTPATLSTCEVPELVRVALVVDPNAK
jgi:hypothetical protein